MSEDVLAKWVASLSNLISEKLYEKYVFMSKVAVLELLLSSEVLIAEKDVTGAMGLPKCPLHINPIKPEERLIFILMPFTESWSDRIWKR